jgi:GPH family glycoside/pentoside/hexuronide:cation symporter
LAARERHQAIQKTRPHWQWWKVAVSIATIISGYLQRFTGFVEGAKVRSESTLFQLRAWEIGLPAAICLISVWLIAKYPLPEARAYEVKALLEQRKKSAASAGVT